MWERGLKFVHDEDHQLAKHVAPRVGAWIEITQNPGYPQLIMSLPVWERGLKYRSNIDAGDFIGRSPCGSVD